MENMPDRIWITMECAGASWAGVFRRWYASDLEHGGGGEEYPVYVRADIVDRLVGALRAQIYEHGLVTEDAANLLDMFHDEDEL